MDVFAERGVIDMAPQMAPQMAFKNKWLCWEITKCTKIKGCIARNRPEVPCWELARELDDYRTILNVCEDCIVYLSHQKNSVLSEKEIREIMEKKGLCVLAAKCSQYTPADK